MIDLSGLNEPQREAAAHEQGALLVFAGAGSGKTKTLTTRAARLIADCGVDPVRMLLVTFTNKAAAEMKERMAPLIGKERCKRIWAGTFHSIGARILRVHADRVDRRRDFVIYDDSDQETVLKQIVAELRLDKKTWSISWMASAIQKAKQEGLSPGDLPTVDPHDAMLVRIWDRYEAWLRSCNALDFEDLILWPMRLAEASSDVGTALRGAFEHVLVDEFQDTNETQYRFVRALAQTGNLCVVGDDDQCIYSWRGAKVANIRGFQKDFPDAKIVKLEQNYRSTGRIVAAAMAVIEQSAMRVPKKLWTAAPPGSAVEVVGVESDREEAYFVVRRMQQLLQQGQPPQSMTVLYRTHVQSRAIEDELRDRQVAYRIVGGHKFYDRKEVKDVLSYLRLVHNPESDVDILRIINVPPRGIGPSTVKRLGEIASSRKIGLWDAVPVAAEAAEIGRRERLQLLAFRETVGQFGRTARDERPSDLARRLIDGVGYRKMWAGSVVEHAKEGDKKKSDDAADRVRNVDEIVNAIAAYETRTQAEGARASLGGYLQVVAIAQESDHDAEVGKVTLMTVHAAKGLEFEHVWIVGFEDGRFPLGAVDLKPMELEEERRLAYVAITRARSRLWISHSETRFVRGKVERCAPSRFLRDLAAAGPQSKPFREYEAESRMRAERRQEEQL